MARDNFAPAVINKLKARVSMRCSNPKCRVPTSAPSTMDASSVKNIGVAAHITAAAPKGPRYDKNMAPSLRGGIENAIWLCSNCSIDIDRDVKEHTVSSLKEWKKIAEDLAIIELGKKLVAESDAIDTLTTALTGLPKTYIPNAISNVHNASEKVLEALDTRFTVKTAYQNGATNFLLIPRESVSLVVRPTNSVKDEYVDKYNQFIKHGMDLRISAGAITFEGSKLIEEIFNKKDGSISFSKKKIPAIQKLGLIQEGTNIFESLEEIKGEISFGIESFTFTGSACNDILKMSYQKFINDENRNTKINFELCLDQWDGMDLNSLPYFEKMMTFFSRIVEGWKISVALEINGEKILNGTSVKFNKENFFLNNNSHFQYIKCCKIIANHTKIQIKYKSTASYTKNEFIKIHKISTTFEGKQIYQKNILKSNATCNLEILNNNLLFIQELSKPASIQFLENSGEEIKLFNSSIQLPPKIISLTNVLAKLEDGIEINSLKIGDVIKVEWVPQENFQYFESYKL